MIFTATPERQNEFWNRIDKSEDCWNWIGGKDKDGYGKTKIAHKYIRCHRLAFAFTQGVLDDGSFSIRDDLCVCHTCDNPSCCNPEHLFLGTNHENTLDSVRKLRHIHGSEHHWYGRRLNGRDNPSCKLKDNDVIEIRRLYSNGILSQRKIAARFGMSQPMIGSIVRRDNWKHIP